MRISFVNTLAALLLCGAASAGAQEAATPAVRVAPVLGSVVPAKYPPGAKEAGEEGMVKLRVRVDDKGWTTDVKVLESSGFPRLDEAAQQAVSHWRYRPGTIDGVATAMQLNVPIRFVLKTSPVQ